MSAQRSKAVSRSLLAILCIALITIALLHLYEPDAERIQSLAAPTPAELETILRAAPPEIQGRDLYDETFARSVVEDAEAALNQVDEKSLPSAFTLIVQNAHRDLATAKEMLRHDYLAEAVRYGNQAKDAAQGLRFMIAMGGDSPAQHSSDFEQRLAVLILTRQEQQVVARRLESTISTVHDFLLLPSIETRLRDALPEQVEFLWKAAINAADPSLMKRYVSSAVGGLTMLENQVQVVDYLLTRYPMESPSPQAPLGPRLSLWVTRESESILAEVAERQSQYPEGTTLAYRAINDARSQAEAAKQDLAARWVANAWSMVTSARADLESARYLALLTSQPTEQESALALDALARIRALALDEIVQASQMTIPGSTEPITALPWFAVRLKEAVRYVHQGDALLQRYSERPEPSSWPDASREAYLQYVHAFTEARRARVAHGSLDIFGVLTLQKVNEDAAVRPFADASR